MSPCFSLFSLNENIERFQAMWDAARNASPFEVKTPSVASWKDHASRLYSDLKNRYGDRVSVTWKRTADDAAELTARAYQELINKGILKYAGEFNDSIMGRIKVFIDGDFAYVFSHSGQLMTRMMKGDRNWNRVFRTQAP